MLRNLIILWVSLATVSPSMISELAFDKARVIDTTDVAADMIPSDVSMAIDESNDDADDDPDVSFEALNSTVCTDAYAGSLDGYPWLVHPKTASDLASNEPLNILAGRMIFHGLVDASGCIDGGMLSNGNASPCGLATARDLVQKWQNQFDAPIYLSGKEMGVPSRLLKATIAQESQFWAGQHVAGHFGLGHLTLGGADVALLWSPELYSIICPQVFGSYSCSGGIGYGSRSAAEKEMLKATLLVLVNPTCPNCAGYVDLKQAENSVPLFAWTLLAHCRQTTQVVYNVTGHIPGDVVPQPELWLLSMYGYNAGSGCLSEAAEKAYVDGGVLTVERVGALAADGCSGGWRYVQDVLWHASNQKGENSIASR